MLAMFVAAAFASLPVAGATPIPKSIIMNAFLESSRNKPKVLFLPLVPKDGVSRELCDRTTADTTAELKKTGLMIVRVSDNYLAELNLPEYSPYSNTLRDRILERCTPDYVLSGYVAVDAATGHHTISLNISAFSRPDNEYSSAFSGMKDIRALIASHVKNIKNLRIFIPDADEKRKKYLKILMEHSPDTYRLVQLIMKDPISFDVLRYLRGAGPLSDEMNTAVHEGNHIHTHSLRTAGTISCFINSKATINVPVTDTFPSRDLCPAIPDNLRTFRYKTYIASPYNPTSTQGSGIYGLLDEFNSYYQGTLVSCDLLAYYKKTFSRTNQSPTLIFFPEYTGPTSHIMNSSFSFTRT